MLCFTAACYIIALQKPNIYQHVVFFFLDDCAFALCLNGGLCSSPGTCDCRGTGYTGQYCEIRMLQMSTEKIALGLTVISDPKLQANSIHNHLSSVFFAERISARL